jgi:hypothetical protein
VSISSIQYVDDFAEMAKHFCTIVPDGYYDRDWESIDWRLWVVFRQLCADQPRHGYRRDHRGSEHWSGPIHLG